MEIIDCHAHYEPILKSDEEIVNNMDKLGITKTVLIPSITIPPPVNEKPHSLMAIQRFMFNSNLLRPLGIAITKSTYSKEGNFKLWFLPGKQTKYTIIKNPNNKKTLDIIKKYPDKFMGWIFINPQIPNSLEVFERFALEKKMIGLKLLPFWHKYDLYEAEPLLKRSEELSLPVSIHLGFSNTEDYLWLLEKFPKLKIILSHLGAPYYKKIWPLVKIYSNLFFDVSSTYHVDKKLIKKAINIISSDRCLFGTDTPHGQVNSAEKIISWINSLPISDSSKEDIFSKNFLKLIKK